MHRSYKLISSSNHINILDISSFGTLSNSIAESNAASHPKGSLIFVIDVNYQKSITSNNTWLAVAMAGLIIYEVLYLNLNQKPRFEKVLELARNISNDYIPPNIKLIPKELLDVIHEQKMKNNLTMVKNEADIFGLLFLGDGTTTIRNLLLDIIASGGVYICYCCRNCGLPRSFSWWW